MQEIIINGLVDIAQELNGELDTGSDLSGKMQYAIGVKGDKGDKGDTGPMPDIDQTYNPTSQNAQSGEAVNQAISNHSVRYIDSDGGVDVLSLDKGIYSVKNYTEIGYIKGNGNFASIVTNQILDYMIQVISSSNWGATFNVFLSDGEITSYCIDNYTLTEMPYHPDQTYSATSKNAQSGKAVAQAVAQKQDKLGDIGGSYLVTEKGIAFVGKAPTSEISPNLPGHLTTKSYVDGAIEDRVEQAASAIIDELTANDTSLQPSDGVQISNRVGVVYTALTTDKPVPITTLQNIYTFYYYTTLTLAVTDVNNGAIGGNATATEATASVGVYTDVNGIPNIVILEDLSETARTTFEADVCVNLGGKLITYTNTVTGLNGSKTKETTLTIDGRLPGSGITITGTGDSAAIAVQPYQATVNIVGGIYTATSDIQPAVCMYTSNAYPMGAVSIESCQLTAYSNTNYTMGVASTKLTVMNNCNISATSINYTGLNYGVYLSPTSLTPSKVSNCTIFADAPSGSMNSGLGVSIGCCVAEGTTVYFNNCNVYGNHSGILVSSGTAHVDGGVYESATHGGFYFSNSDGVSYIKNATIAQVPYKGNLPTYVDSGVKGGFYIGGSANKDNISAYIDNCVFKSTGSVFVMRGTDGEQNNTVYVSNCTISEDTTGSIRIDNATHKLYIGKDCNFDASRATLPSAVVSTNDIYLAPTDVITQDYAAYTKRTTTEEAKAYTDNALAAIIDETQQYVDGIVGDIDRLLGELTTGGGI